MSVSREKLTKVPLKGADDFKDKERQLITVSDKEFNKLTAKVEKPNEKPKEKPKIVQRYDVQSGNYITEIIQPAPEKDETKSSNKKKKKTVLKKLILAEREERGKATGAAEPGSEAAVSRKPAAESSEGAPSVPPADAAEVPEFVPFVSTPLRILTRPQPEAPPSAVEGDGSGVGQSRPAAVPAAPAASFGSSFVPSWCRAEPALGSAAGPATGAANESVPGSAAPSSAQQPPSAATSIGDARAAPTEELPVAQAMMRLQPKESRKRDAGAAEANGAQGKQKKAKDPKPSGCELEVRHYVHQVLSDDLDEKVKYIFGELVRFQERAKADPMKYAKNKRFCVGLRETQRSVQRGKAKALICAPNIEVCSMEGGLDDRMEDLIEICRENDVPVVFALSRNRIGKALGRNVRQSAVAVLSAEGVHQEFKAVLRQTEELRRQWVMHRMSHCDGPVPVPARLPRGALDAVFVSDVGEDEMSFLAGGSDAGDATTGDEAGPTERRGKISDDQQRLRDLLLLEQERVAADARAAATAERAAERRAAVEARLAEKRAEEEKKRAEEREIRAKEKKEQKKLKEAERRARKQAEKDAKEREEEADRLQEEATKAARALQWKEIDEKRQREEEEIQRRAAILREKAAAEAERLQQEEEARLAALENQVVESDSDDSDLPAGFNADLF